MKLIDFFEKHISIRGANGGLQKPTVTEFQRAVAAYLEDKNPEKPYFISRRPPTDKEAAYMLSLIVTRKTNTCKSLIKHTQYQRLPSLEWLSRNGIAKTTRRGYNIEVYSYMFSDGREKIIMSIDPTTYSKQP